MFNPLACNWGTTSLYSYVQNVSEPVILYAHLAPLVLAIVLLVTVSIFDRKTLINKALIALIFFSCGSLFTDLLIWLLPQSEYIIFWWATLIFFEMAIYICAFYFMYVYIFERDIPFTVKGLVGALYTGVVLFLSSPYAFSYFDLTNCDRDAKEGPLILFLYIPYAVVIGLVILMALFGMYRYRSRIMSIVTMTLGMLFFLGAFYWGNIVGSITTDWLLSQIGFFALPVFMGFLADGVFKERFENARVLSVQFFIASIILLIGGQFFFVHELLGQVLVCFTLVLIGLFSFILTRAIRSELKQKEKLRLASESLTAANQQLKELDNAKTEFLSIASHQLRTPLTAIKGYISLILEGSYGEVSVTVQDVLNKLYLVNSRMVNLAEDLLNVSRIDAGRVQYNYHLAHIEKVLQEAVEVFRLNAQDKGLELTLELPENELPEMMMDARKIQEVCSNLVDNSIKYTPKGGVHVKLVGAADRAIITVSDTGIGIAPENKEKLFAKFVRSKETNILDVSGTGLGLYVGKNFVEAHGGRIYADSPGKDKGSIFTIELPYVNPKLNETSPNWMLNN